MAGGPSTSQPASLGVCNEEKVIRVFGPCLCKFAPGGICAWRNRSSFLLSKRQKECTQRDPYVGARAWMSHRCRRAAVTLLASCASTNESSRRTRPPGKRIHDLGRGIRTVLPLFGWCYGSLNGSKNTGQALGIVWTLPPGIEPEEVKVLADSGEATLTLVTGSPSYFVGPPPRKFIATRAQIPR